MDENLPSTLTLYTSRVRPDGSSADCRKFIKDAETMSDELLIEYFKGMIKAYRRECKEHPSETKSPVLHQG